MRRVALSANVYKRPVFFGGLCRFARGSTPGCPLGSWVWANSGWEFGSRSTGPFTRLSPGVPWKPGSRSISRCPLTTAHAIWRNRLEPPGYEPGGTHPRAHERVYGPQNTSMASFERLIAAPCSISTSDGVHVQTSDQLDRHPELPRPSDHIWGALAERATASQPFKRPFWPTA